MFGITLVFLGHRGRQGAECERIEWKCEEKSDNILLKERN